MNSAARVQLGRALRREAGFSEQPRIGRIRPIAASQPSRRELLFLPHSDQSQSVSLGRPRGEEIMEPRHKRSVQIGACPQEEEVMRLARRTVMVGAAAVSAVAAYHPLRTRAVD